MKTFKQLLKENIELPLVKINFDGKTFETGKPVSFNYVKNLEKAPQLGARFQQDIEPHGRYMSMHSKSATVLPNFEYGTVKFKNPLVINFSTTNGGYDENNWKYKLSNYYKKKGKALSTALKKDGYDGIITVDMKWKALSEIIKL